MTGNIPMVSTAPGRVGTGFFKPKGDTRRLRKASSLSIHRGEWPSVFSAASRASSAVPSTTTLKASLNCAPGNNLPAVASGSTV
jgi:hypothetical protein